VGIVRVQRELALWTRRRLPGTAFAVYDPRHRAFRRISPRHLDAFLTGQASLNAWAMPDPTGRRPRRSARIPTPLYAALQARRTALRILERLRLAPDRPRVSRFADRLQRRLITPRYHAAMLNPDGTRRAHITPDLAFAEPIEFAPSDVLVCAGFGWSHGDIAAIATAKASSGFRLAVLCYDLIPLVFPELFKPHDVTAMREYWKTALPAADVIVVNSHAVAGDVRRYCSAERLSLERLIVRPLGSDPASLRAGVITSLPATLEAGRYVLLVSTIEPRKGHEMLYRIWLDLLAEGVPQAHGFKLVFVGRPGWDTERLEQALRTDERIARSLFILSDVSDADLDSLYRGAAFCLYPSLYEGYGLPVVEAFSRGKAVISSNGGALTEVVGRFSPALPPRDEGAWRETLRLWIEDPSARAPYEAAIRDDFSPLSWDAAAAGFFEGVAAALGATWRS
jgi:glycosyltransferase involved in cell wall biosynthesis